eukprot:4308835-Amphidinium_carterae.1
MHFANFVCSLAWCDSTLRHNLTNVVHLNGARSVYNGWREVLQEILASQGTDVVCVCGHVRGWGGVLLA